MIALHIMGIDIVPNTYLYFNKHTNWYIISEIKKYTALKNNFHRIYTLVISFVYFQAQAHNSEENRKILKVLCRKTQIQKGVILVDHTMNELTKICK